MSKEYLGDGAYVDFDGWALWLTAEDGIRATDRICLEPAVWARLKDYVRRLEEEASRSAPEATAP